MRALGLAAVLALTVAAAGAQAPEAATHVRQIPGARIVEATLPGRMVGTPATVPGGVMVLVAPIVPGEDADDEPVVDDDAPRRLFRFDPAGDGQLVELAASLPPELDAVTLFDADGRLFVPSPRDGRLDAYRLDASGRLSPVDGFPVDLPVRARRVSTGLVLSLPQIHLLERDGEPPLVALGPETQGPRRLLSTLIDPGDPEATTEAWSHFTANEKVARSWYLQVDGRPMLAVAALEADKLGIFEKQKLRVFPLRADRTRAGSPPALEIHTVTRNWYQLGVHVADVDLDGRDDLVVVQPDGLGAKKLAVEVYRGQGNGGFYTTPRRTVIVAPAARWAFGEDLDGDGVGDLVTLAEDRLEIFRGLAEHKRKALDKQPYRRLEVADLGADTDLELVVHVGDDGDSGDRDWGLAGAEPPRIVDFDGDGRGEILLVGDRDGRTLLWVIELM